MLVPVISQVSILLVTVDSLVLKLDKIRARPNRIVNEALLERILLSVSWSVEYEGDAYDDARSVDGIWYFRDLLTYEYETFPLQSGVVPLFENP
jgi:hypothetical protein